nr:hypothetical protein [Tanacetum cinerariifolium]
MEWVGRGVKEKQVLLAYKSVEFSKQVNEVLGTNSATKTPIVVNAGLGLYPTLSKGHGNHSHDIRNVENMNDAGYVELKDNIVVDMPKLVGKGFYTCTVYVEYEWKPLRCACCKVFGHVQDVYPKNIDSDLVKNIKKPSQVPRGVLVGPKPRLIIDKKVTRVDDEGKPLKKVDSMVDHDREDEVASVDNRIANFMASKKVSYGTNSLFEQWKETYENDDYDFDPYDDDMYEGQDNPDKI